MTNHPNTVESREVRAAVEDLVAEDECDALAGGIASRTVAEYLDVHISTAQNHLTALEEAGELVSVWGVGPRGPRKGWLPPDRVGEGDD